MQQAVQKGEKFSQIQVQKGEKNIAGLPNAEQPLILLPAKRYACAAGNERTRADGRRIHCSQRQSAGSEQLEWVSWNWAAGIGQSSYSDMTDEERKKRRRDG